MCTNYFPQIVRKTNLIYYLSVQINEDKLCECIQVKSQLIFLEQIFFRAVKVNLFTHELISIYRKLYFWQKISSEWLFTSDNQTLQSTKCLIFDRWIIPLLYLASILSCYIKRVQSGIGTNFSLIIRL